MAIGGEKVFATEKSRLRLVNSSWPIGRAILIYGVVALTLPIGKHFEDANAGTFTMVGLGSCCIYMPNAFSGEHS